MIKAHGWDGVIIGNPHRQGGAAPPPPNKNTCLRPCETITSWASPDNPRGPGILETLEETLEGTQFDRVSSRREVSSAVVNSRATWAMSAACKAPQKRNSKLSSLWSNTSCRGPLAVSGMWCVAKGALWPGPMGWVFVVG